MRIALIAPVARSITPSEESPLEKKLRVLADGLVDAGMDVILFATGDSVTKARLAGSVPTGYIESGADPEHAYTVHFGAVFERAGEFDIIHNHTGFRALSYSKLIETPMVSTVHSPLSSELLEIHRKYNGRVYYIGADKSVVCPEIEFVETLDAELAPEPLALMHIDVYEKICEMRKREDHRPWGYYRILSDEPDHKVKRIVVYPGKRLSLQRHFRRSEHWNILFGKAVITFNDGEIHLGAGKSIDLPVGTVHRIMNPGPENLVFIEVQTGDYFGEDDIERFEDDFGRT